LSTKASLGLLLSWISCCLIGMKSIRSKTSRNPFRLAHGRGKAGLGVGPRGQADRCETVNGLRFCLYGEEGWPHSSWGKSACSR
jgi:hypothetical protein